MPCKHGMFLQYSLVFCQFLLIVKQVNNRRGNTNLIAKA